MPNTPSHKLYIGLGTNLGDRLDHLNRARQALLPEIKIMASSPVYETPPWGYLNQPAFLNQVIQAETGLSPAETLALLKRLEKELGRIPGILNGPRAIDLDLLFYDDLILDTPPLTIPHPRIIGRGFVLVPLADLAPELRHPVTEIGRAHV